MKKIIVITGPRGSGKSTALARYAKPSELSKMVVVDTEDSMSDLIESNSRLGLQFGSYLRAYERFKADNDMLSAIAQNKLPWVSSQQKSALADYYQWFVKALDETLKSKSYKYLAIDTIEPIEAAMTAWAESNRQLSGWSGNRSYGKLEVEAVRPLYENLLEAIARRGIETILLSSHLRRVWENDKPVLNKTQPGGRLAILSRLSSMMFWLVPSDNPDGAPAAIVLKARKGSESVENDSWIIRRPLPRRIPHFTWADVAQYEVQGCDLAHPATGETLSNSEMEMISEFLTDDQMRLMVLGAEMEIQNTPLVVAPTPAPENGNEIHVPVPPKRSGLPV